MSSDYGLRDTGVTEGTYVSLRNMILSGEIKPGTVLEERRIAEELGVSRTPLRAAVNRLLGEELVTRLSNGSLMATNLTLQDFLAIAHVRQLLESEAAAFAAGKIPDQQLEYIRDRINRISTSDAPDEMEHLAIDDWIHSTIASASGNSFLEKVIRDIRERARMCSIRHNPRRLRETCEEHLALLEAIERGDSDGARLRMKEHIDGIKRGLLALLVPQ